MRNRFQRAGTLLLRIPEASRFHIEESRGLFISPIGFSHVVGPRDIENIVGARVPLEKKRFVENAFAAQSLELVVHDRQ
jgi:hypothetical protein